MAKKHPQKKQRSKPTTWYHKAWDYFWNGDSWGSWLLNIVVAFIVIKFIVYPLLALLFGTNLPVVAVVSGSMQHEGSFDDWWSSLAICDIAQPCTQEKWYAQYNITKEDFKAYSLSRGFNKGDLILLKGIDEEEIAKGDVLVFDSVTTKGTLPVIHRVVTLDNSSQSNLMIQTKGDHNTRQLQTFAINEKNISYSSVRGKAYARIPFVGYVKLGVVNLFNTITGKQDMTTQLFVS